MKSTEVLKAFLGECVRTGDWHGARDAAAELEIAEAEARGRREGERAAAPPPVAPELEEMASAVNAAGVPGDMRAALAAGGRFTHGTLVQPNGLAIIRMFEPLVEGNESLVECAERVLQLLVGVRPAMERATRAAMQFGMESFFGEEPPEGESTFHDGAAPEKLAEVIEREFLRAGCLLADAKAAVTLRDALVEKLGVDEDDVLAKLDEFVPLAVAGNYTGAKAEVHIGPVRIEMPREWEGTEFDKQIMGVVSRALKGAGDAVGS